MSALGLRRSALTTGLGTLLAATILVLSGGPAGAVPPEPVNPSDSDIQSSQDQADGAAAEVGRLAGLVSKTEGDIDRLRADMELKGERAKAAILNVQLANQDAADAQAQAMQAAQQVTVAQQAVDKAQQAAAEFAAASFRQGSIVGSLTSFLDATDATEVLSRQQLLDQVSANQASVIAKLESARVAKANAESGAKQARDQAIAAQASAVAAQQQAQQQAADSFASGQQQLQVLQSQLQDQQDAYVAAMSKVADLKEKRQAYIDWLAEKRAEEERMRQLAAEQARQAAARAAAEKVAEEQAAEQRKQAELEAEQAQAAQLAAEKAAAAAAQKAADEKAAKEKAEADRLAAEKAQADRIAKQKEEAAKAAAQKAEETKRAIDKLAADKAAAAKAAAEKKQREMQAQLDAQRAAQLQEAAQIKKIERSKFYADCGAAEKAGVIPIKKGSPGYRPELDRNGNGVACEKLSDSAAQPGNQPPAQTQTPTASPTKAPTQSAPPVKEVYYASCAEAELAGVTPIKRGDPGYRIGLDRNNNGIACETLPDSGGSGGDTPIPSSNDGVASDRGASGARTPGAWTAAKGEAAVAAAMRWVGTPYSWGGGNSSGPTTGICGPDGAWNDCNIVGFDCSGLTSYAWSQAGISLVALSATQWWQGQHISQDSLMPGDLLMYADDTSDPSSIHHVAMYIGGGQMIEAPYSGAYVHVTSAKFGGDYIGATRPGT